ncbi:hypothetical protein [Sulfurovum mangrovi]|uniref:hypothetical protein n=1 Tax=Sulfurovum mangrovi TaxID=2893889 RepID=UPI001E3BB7B9|nr:hypothetical protein [Sulfurovum mangrovi]UFH60262.1 hypothetical protein LN246_05285 [Sulfurovum mangrovi]
MNNREFIYTLLLDEGIDVWKPVEAEKLDGNRYRILEDDKKAFHHYLEKWEFKMNDIVKCEYRTLTEGRDKKHHVLVAVEKLN